jgi:hypothetical protein
MAAKKAISVIERRLQGGGSALQTTSQPIPLKEKGWTLRWENSEIRPDQIWHCINVLGWEYVVPGDIDATMEEIGAAERDSRVVRGERGKEVLLKMRASDFKKVQAKKTTENIDLTFNKGKVKDAMLNAVAGSMGPEAAEYVARMANKQDGLIVQDGREQVNVDE